MLNNIQPGPRLPELAILLLKHHYLTSDVLYSAISQANESGLSLANYLVKANLISSQAILTCCMDHYSLPVFDLKDYDYTWLNHSLINAELMCRYRVIPLKQDKNILQLGVSDPSNETALSAIRFHTGLFIQPMLIDENELDAFIKIHGQANVLHSKLENTLSTLEINEEPTIATKEIRQDWQDEPVIAFVDQLLADALNKQVSDIHIEPYAQNCRIRFRRDGLLYEAATLPLHLAERIIIRLKILANLNITERRLPQDGHLTVKHVNQIDIRLNSCATRFGEKIVLRLLDTQQIHPQINTLGLAQQQEQLFLAKITQPQGLVLVTGPTGSGKTLTLYSALNYLNQVEKNILTVEDPIEIELPGINQVMVNTRIGLDFSMILRSFLRQDPDIIMIGEIRDTETAEIAIQAAETGHLVLASLHTNHALQTITRLESMGINTHHLTHTLSLIVTQRLVRKVCHYCQQNSQLVCSHCHQGYIGRVGIFECLAMTEDIADLINKKVSHDAIYHYLKNNNWLSLWDAGREKIESGLTTHAELIRVLGEQFNTRPHHELPAAN